MLNYENKIIEAIEIIVKKLLAKQGFDYTITGKIVSGTASPYLVLYQGEQLSIPAREGLTLAPDDIVYIRVPSGNFVNKFIDCKRP